MIVEVDIDDILDGAPMDEVLDYYDIDDIIEYVEQKGMKKPVIDVESALRNIAATRMSPNLTRDKELVRRTLSEIINEIFF